GGSIRQTDLRRPPQGREGCNDLHHPRSGGPPYGRPSPRAREGEVQLLPRARVRGKARRPRSGYPRLPQRSPRSRRRNSERLRPASALSWKTGNPQISQINADQLTLTQV